MVVAVAVFTVRIPEAASLKEKRHVIRPLIERLHRDAFAASEVEHMDEHTRSRIGIAAVGNDAAVLRSAIDRLFDQLERDHPGAIMDEEYDIMTFGGSD